MLTTLTGLIFGDIYLAFFSVFSLIPIFFLIKTLKWNEGWFGFLKKKIFTKKEKKESYDEMQDKETEEDYDEVQDKETKDKDTFIKENDYEDNVEIEETENIKKDEYQKESQNKLCPYCNKPLTYVSQYQRYYCYSCQRYI